MSVAIAVPVAGPSFVQTPLGAEHAGPPPPPCLPPQPLVWGALWVVVALSLAAIIVDILVGARVYPCSITHAVVVAAAVILTMVVAGTVQLAAAFDPERNRTTRYGALLRHSSPCAAACAMSLHLVCAWGALFAATPTGPPSEACATAGGVLFGVTLGLAAAGMCAASTVSMLAGHASPNVSLAEAP
jgi:hypothetical protein